MSEFSLPILFVVPTGNTLPTTGSTQNLTDGQFGIFKDDARTIATAGNVGTAKYIQLFQGREATIAARLGTKASDKINIAKLKKFYKVTGSSTAQPEIYTINNWTGKCGEDITLTILAHSSYIDTISYNGLTRSITIKAPCCDCGASPCDTVDPEALVNLIIAKIAQIDAVQKGANALKIDTFFTFAKVGSGPTTSLTVTSNPLTVYGQPCDVAVDTQEFDRIWFRVFVYKAPNTTADFITYDSCDPVATITLTQRSTFPRLIAPEVAQMEYDYYSYQAPFKHLFRTMGYNPYFESFVVAGTVYTQYVIQYDELNQYDAWTQNIKEDERAIIMIPNGQTAAIEAILVAYLGAITDETGGTSGGSVLEP